MLRIINKQTGMFLRDDFSFDEEIEIGLEVNPAQGLYQPKWNGEKWIEGLTEAEILAIKNQSTEVQPTLEERVTEIEQVTTEVFEQLNDKGLI